MPEASPSGPEPEAPRSANQATKSPPNQGFSPPGTTEPSEPIEPSPPPSLPGRLSGEHDGSAEERDLTAERALALGIDTSIHKAFPCVLPGHEDKAQLHPTTHGFWQYFCPGVGRRLGLAEVRAWIAHGRETYVRGALAARWRERLDMDAWLRWPVPLDLELPEPCPEAASVLAGWMRVFVGLRDPQWPLDEPFVFAHDFAQAYTGLSAHDVRAAKSWLERARVLHRRGTHGRSVLWVLEAQLQSSAQESPENRRGRSHE